MNLRFHSMRLVVGLGASALICCAHAQNLPDRLERPSPMSDFAHEAPLMDVQRLGERLVMVGEGGHVLLRESDGAVAQARVPVNLLLTAVHFVDAQNGWAVGHDGVVLHSSDGGRSWSKQLDGNAINQQLLTWAEAEVRRLEAASAETLSAALDNALFALDDAKASSESGPARPLLDVWFRDAHEGWVVGAYGVILHTADGGATWNYIAGLDNPDRLHLNSVLGLADGSLLVAGEGGRLYRQVDGQWLPAQQLAEASLYHLQRLADGRLLTMGFGGTLLLGTDGGAQWQSLALPFKTSLFSGTELADGGLLLAGQAGTLIYSPDLKHFQRWSTAGKAPLTGVAQVAAQQLVVVGGAGLFDLPLAKLKEQLQ